MSIFESQSAYAIILAIYYDNILSVKLMKVIKCKNCGFSKMVGLVARFNDNGTITHRFSDSFRAVLVEADFMDRLLEEIESELGIPIMHIVFEAQRNGSKATIEDVGGIALKLAVFGWQKRQAVAVFCRVAIWTGMGFAKKLEYRPGKSGEALVRNPFNKELMAAVIVGAFESLEKKPFSHRWEDYGAESVIHIESETERPEISERLEYKSPNLKPGERHFERCRKCNVPSKLSSLFWNVDDGIIWDMERSVRMVFLDAYTTNAVLRELIDELGEDVLPIITEAMKSFAVSHIEDDFEKEIKKGIDKFDRYAFYETQMELMSLYGLGNPVSFEFSGSSLSVRIQNPFNIFILAGRLLALYDTVEGRKSEITWQIPDEQTVDYLVKPSYDAQHSK